jgi:hypothetical protein
MVSYGMVKIKIPETIHSPPTDPLQPLLFIKAKIKSYPIFKISAH